MRRLNSIRSLFLATIPMVVVLSLQLNGCRIPDPPILKGPQSGLIYDTAWEDEIRSGKPRLRLIEGIWEPYVDTLSEPVAVQEWRSDSSMWEVFFGTNRGVHELAATTDLTTPQVIVGNEVRETPAFGRVEIILPHRTRGQEPLSVEGRSARTQNVGQLSQAEFLSGVQRQLQHSRQQDLLLFVHGFNVSFDACLIRTAQLGADIPFNGALVAYSWPTQGGVLNYDGDEQINADSVTPFAQFLQLLIDALPENARLKIVVHSMGNRIVLKAINSLPGSSGSQTTPGSRKPIAIVCLCAPDVGIGDYEQLIPGVVARCERVLLYANSGDTALQVSRRLHLEQRSGDASRPAVARGVELIDCSRVDLTFLGHSYFSSNVSVLTDLFHVLKEDKAPTRRPHLKQRKISGEGPIWYFDQHPHRVLWTWNFDRVARLQ